MKLTIFRLSILTTIALTAVTSLKAVASDEQLTYQPKMHKPESKVSNSSKKTNHDKAISAGSSSKKTLQCSFILSNFTDNRQNKDTVGTNFSTAIYSTGIETWLRDAKADLWEKEITGTGTEITIKPSLTRLYTYTQSMNIHGVMAYDVEFIRNGKVIDSKKYRALGSKANMANGVAEHYTALNYAAYEAMPLLVADLPAICNSAKR